MDLAPTPGNYANLIREGINESKIVVTGNTVIDALRWASGQAVDYGHPSLEDLDEDPRRVILAWSAAASPGPTDCTCPRSTTNGRRTR